MAKERIAYIDFMKGLCMIFIVMGHVSETFFESIEPLTFLLQSHRVWIPMYFFLSGLFFKKYSNFSDFLRKKVNGLIITLLFFHFLSSAFRLPLVAIVHAIRPDIDIQFTLINVVPPFFGRFWEAAGALWFLVALFMVNILYYIFQRYFKQIGTLIAVIICSLVGWKLMQYKVQMPFELDIALVALPYYMLGSVVKRFGLLEPSKFDKLGLLAIIPCALIVYHYSTNINLLFQVAPHYLDLYVVPFIGILSLFWCCKNLGYVPVINYCGRYSIIILGTHQIIISYITFALLGFLTIRGISFNVIVFFLVMLIELVLIIPVMKNFFPRFTAQKDFFLPGWKISE